MQHIDDLVFLLPPPYWQVRVQFDIFEKHTGFFVCVRDHLERALCSFKREYFIHMWLPARCQHTQCYRVALLFHILCSILFPPLSTISWEEEEQSKAQLQSRVCTQSCTTFPLQHSVVQRKYSWASLGKKTSLAMSERYSAIP